MKIRIAALVTLAALLAPGASSQPPERGAFKAMQTTSTPLARGEQRAWTWRAPSGAYMAYVRVNFRLHAPNRDERGDYMKGDSRLNCRISGEGRNGGYDEASAYVGGDQATATGAYGTGSDDEYFSLVAAVEHAFGSEPTNVTLTCNNTTISATAGPIMIDRISVNLVPVASIGNLELVPERPRPASTSPTPPASPTVKPAVPTVPKATPAVKPPPVKPN